MAGTAAGHHQPRRRRLPDLVVDSEIDTTRLGKGCVQHIFREPPTATGERLSRTTQTWHRRSTIVPGRVFLEDCRGGEVRAVKVLDTELDWESELEALAKFSGPRYAHCFVNSDGWFKMGGDVVVAMEYIELGDLGRHLVKPLAEFEARDIVRQLLEGLEYMHHAGFVHRNLAPENIMVAACNPRWIVKIGGFGCVTRDPVDVTIGCSKNRLSEKYSAPELLSLVKTTPATAETSQVDIASAVDMWSLGAITFRLLTSLMPFNSSKDLKDYMKQGRISQAGQDFIMALMAPESRDRPSATEAASHPWLQSPSSARGHITPPQYVPAPRSGQSIDLDKIEVDLTKLRLRTSTPSPARAQHTPTSDPSPKLTPDRYSPGDKGFVRLGYEYHHGHTSAEPSGRYVNPFSTNETSQAQPIPAQQASPTSRPALHRQGSIKRKPSRDPDEQPPSLQKRPSLKKTDDDDDFATEVGINPSSTASTTTPPLDRHAADDTCSETLIGHADNTPSPRHGPLAELLAIQARLETEVLPQCAALVSARPTAITTKEHARLSEALVRILEDLDGVRRGDDGAARALGKQLANRVHLEAGRLDEAFATGGWRWWDCFACRRPVRFGRGARSGTYEVDGGEGTNMVIVAEPLYVCGCRKGSLCLPCGLVEGKACDCYTKSGRRRRRGDGSV